MKSSWVRKRVLPFVLACAGAQVAPGGMLLASALALGLHASDHVHSFALVADAGHLHLVLSHDERSHQDAGDARHHGDPATSAPERNHVVRLTDGDDAATASRRAGLSPAPAVATAVAALPAPAPMWVPCSSPQPRARSSDSLRTIVLRL